MKNCINILVVCNYGIGCGPIAAAKIHKQLNKIGILNIVKNDSLNNLPNYFDWSDIVIIQNSLHYKYENTPVKSSLTIKVKNILEVDDIIEKILKSM